MIGTFGGGEGEDVVDELDEEVVDLFLGGAGGGGVIGRTFTLHSLEFRFGEIRAGKLRVLVHCERLRTMMLLLLLLAVVIIVSGTVCVQIKLPFASNE